MWSDEVSNTCLNFRVILIPKSSSFTLSQPFLSRKKSDRSRFSKGPDVHY